MHLSETWEDAPVPWIPLKSLLIWRFIEIFTFVLSQHILVLNLVCRPFDCQIYHKLLITIVHSHFQGQKLLFAYFEWYFILSLFLFITCITIWHQWSRKIWVFSIYIFDNVYFFFFGPYSNANARKPRTEKQNSECSHFELPRLDSFAVWPLMGVNHCRSSSHVFSLMYLF